MIANKRWLRVVAMLLLVVCVLSSVPVKAKAYDVNCNSVVSSRTFSIYKRWTQSIKIHKLSEGTAKSPVGMPDLKMYGCYHVTVYDPSGKIVKDTDWNGRTTITLVKSLTKVGTYKVVVSAPKIPSVYPGIQYNPRNNQYYWCRYPGYRISW